MAVATYYFDGHTTVSDVDSNWTDESNFIDDSAVTSAYALLEGSTSTNYLLVTGTTAPSSGGEILQVRAKLMGSSTEWVVLDVPSTGGWTWAKLQELQTRVYTVDINQFTTHCYASVYAPNGELPPEYIGTTIRESLMAYGLEIEVTYTESGTSANAERGLYIAGYSTSNSTRGLYLQGYLTSDSTRGLYIEGFVDTLYSRESSASLKAGDSNLSTMFSEQDYTDVATDDDTFVDLEGTAQYFQLLFKEPNGNENNTDVFTVTWKGKSTLAPSSSAVYLQIYNRTTESWTTLVSNSSASANVEFTLEDTVSTDLSDYYDTNYIISVRVYQDGVV